MSTNPFVVGQWVRGDRHYGRGALIEEILEGQRNWLWLLGTRRIGKTSLLKQLELVTLRRDDARYFPVFWDFQGAEQAEDLHRGLSDALLDAEEGLGGLGLCPDDVAGRDLFSALAKLRRALRARERKLLLLCDEVEELIGLSRKDPGLLAKLRRAMQSHDDVRSVLASTMRLWELASHKADTSPFLHGFAPPLYIRGLTPGESRSLIRQAHLPEGARPVLDDDTVETIRARCDDHPYLLQLVCKRYLELGHIDDAIEQVALDPMVRYFFSVDFEMLSAAEQAALHAIAEVHAANSNSIQGRLGIGADGLGGVLQGLEQLGYIRRNAEKRFELVNYFFQRWLRERAREAGPRPADVVEVLSKAPAAPPAGAQTPELFDGRYEMLRELGRGAMGVVHAARDRMLEEEVAIKLLKSEYAANAATLERFRREILLARDIGHPNILKVYHLGDAGGQRYLTMKLIDGPSLSRLIREHGPLSPERVVAIARRLAAALEAAHQHDVVHRDVKPENVLVDREGTPYLTDFGIARLKGEPGLTQTGVFVGTPYYASPEQARMLPADHRSDVYSLGVVIFEMCTSRRPFVADSIPEVLRLHREGEVPDPRQYREGVPHELARIIRRCMEKDPERRFRTAAELSLALDTAAGTG